MGRAPCCEKMGLKKGPWTPEEDQTLVSFVQQFGHGNWRALPKQAGLLRCGKSCRLRWMNYLRPDIKRGNFTRDEEEMIIKLHQVIGNRWSAIAAKLPGRTDNEIKNVWHTHLKKRLHLSDINNTNSPSSIAHYQYENQSSMVEDDMTTIVRPNDTLSQHPSKFVEVSRKDSESENGSDMPVSPQHSTTTTDLSTATATACTTTTVTSNINDYFPEMPSDDFWTHMLSSNVTFSTPVDSISEFKLSPMDRLLDYNVVNTLGHGDGDERDFWCNLFSKMGEFPELLEM